MRPDQNTTYFKNLDEAIITTLTIRFLNQFGDAIPALAEELRRRTQFIEALPEEVRDKATNDIARVVQTLDNDEGGWTTEIIPYPYPQEREELDRLLTDLQEKNDQEFVDSEQILALFVQAVLNGKLLPLARLVEKTYGRGSFRRLGEEQPG